ncbi:hypothetical protein D3C72_2583460 [compost metagenome]
MGGTISNTSRITAATNGSTMNASTIPAARMPKPLVLPPNRKPTSGMDPSSFCTGIWK